MKVTTTSFKYTPLIFRVISADLRVCLFKVSFFAIMSDKASKCHGRATAQNLAELAQNLDMCTPEIEK